MDIDEHQEKGVVYWLPKLVVTGTIVGFVSLAAYAYQTGTQSMNEEDLPIIEAEKAPIKERPDDPGGMKFPNQDKTVFETFGGNTQVPPKVERVLPSPEEPMPKKLDTSETRTWINEKLHRQEEEATQSSVTLPIKEVDKVAKNAASVEAPKVEQPVTATAAPVESVVTVTPADKKTSPVLLQVEKDQASASEDAKPAAKAKEDAVATKTAEVKVKAPEKDSGVRVQLGAYKSETEAKEAFAKMQKKFAVLGGKKPVVVKADLGAKGTYYRLRVGGFSAASEAQSMCKVLSAKQQACIIAK